MLWLRNKIISRGYSDLLIFNICTLFALLIFVADFETSKDIRLHVLYIFPLAIVANYCSQFYKTFFAFLLNTTLQVITFNQEALATASFITDTCVAIMASILIVYLARSARNNYLAVSNLASTDSLTGITNRRAFVEAIESEIARQKRYEGTFSLACLDLDGFKQLNDTHGHAVGDEALKLATEILLNCTRETDCVGRIGGDEFAILMPNTQIVDCSSILEKLHTTIETRMSERGFAVTASIGCKNFEVAPDNAFQVLLAADKIMYEAKKRGKNCIVIY